MNLYGRQWSRRELEARLGRIEQIGGIRRVQSTEGKEAGVEEIQVRTGAGLAYSILPSRGLDIGLTEYAGMPLCWLSPNVAAHPGYFDDRDLGWLKTAVGGLLMTCGLAQVGSPCEENGENLGLHGRAHHTPARHVCAEGHWDGDEYRIAVQGKVEETSISGWNLHLTRHIRSSLGKNEIVIQDVVENAGFEPAPHMLLYHFNFGFPLLDAHTEIHFPAGDVIPREPDLLVECLAEWQLPQAGFRERVYYHENLSTGPDGVAAVTIHNPHFPFVGRPLVVRLAWDTHNLPVLVQWKMPAEGIHVLGIEPSNCHVEGRVSERERGTLVMLAPGQMMEYHLEISVSEE
jgi:hypothetical protein